MADTKITITFAASGVQVEFNQIDGLSPGHLERAFVKVQRAFHELNARDHQARTRTFKEETERARQKREKEEGVARTKAMNDAAEAAAKATRA